MRAAGERRPLLLGSLALVLLAAYVATSIEVTTDITHFLPGGEADDGLLLARELAAGELSRMLVLVVTAADEAGALRASRAFEAALLDEPRVTEGMAFLQVGVPDGIEESLWQLYEPRRFSFLEAEPGARLTDDALAEAAVHLRDQLATPLSSLVSKVAPRDPLLILPRLFEASAGAQGDRLRIVQGRFLTHDGHGAVLFLGSRAPSFDSTAQRPLLAGIESAFQRVDDESGGDLTLHSSGASRFALRAEDAIKRDIQRVTIGSLLGLVALLWWLFGSLRLVLLTVPVVSAGFLVGTASCLLLQGSIHGLTLAFGAALIGVSIDYTIHVHCHQTVAPHPEGARATVRRLWTGLALGAATTIVGFVALLVSDFPGMRELAVFSATGIAAALVSTRVFLPGLLPERPAERMESGRAAAVGVRIERIMDRLARHRRVVLGALVLVAATAAVGLGRVRWVDDLADLNQLDPELLAEDAAVREQVMRYEQSRLVVATGTDEQAALEVNDRVLEVLHEAQAAGELQSFRNLGLLLPSARLQRARDAVLRADPTLWERTASALGDAGFVVEAFAPFRDDLLEPPPAPLLYEDLVDTPLASLVRPFRVSLPGQVGVLSFLAGLEDEAALAHRLDAIPGARLVDITAELTAAYGTYRERMTQLLLLGLVAVVALVALRHRRLRPTLAACLPAFLAAAATVALLALAGVALNILSLVALLMVVSMGVDYGVFLAESGGDREAHRATHLALLVSGISTMLGFGLLALSAHPSLFSIGSTAGLGVLLCLLFAPLVNLLTQPPPSFPDPPR